MANRIKQLRLSRGWTLDELVAQIGGIVSKQAISKYELNLDRPSTPVLSKIAAAFGVKTIHLFSEPKYRIQLVAYRKKCALPKKEQHRIESLVRERFEERLKIQNLVSSDAILDVPVNDFPINKVEEAEEAADSLRKSWHLGQDQISNLTGLLESKLVHVLEVDASEKFDGMAALAYDNQNIKGTAIVVRKGIPGGRQRLNLSHELGHLVLKVSKNVDVEDAAFRFGAAFLAPKEWVLREVGRNRTALGVQELIILKKRFGISIQAIIYRLKTLNVISDSYYTSCMRYVSNAGWKKQEPLPLPVEKPEWLKQNVYKAVSESLLSQSEAEMVIGEKIEDGLSLSLRKMRSFMTLPMEERRRLLLEQAEKAIPYYESDQSRGIWQAGDFLGE